VGEPYNPLLTISDSNLAIRPWQKEKDDPVQHTWPSYSDPFSDLWNIPKRLSLGDEFILFFSQIAQQRRIWAVLNHDEALIGRISLRDIEMGEGRARLGITISAPYIGQGIGTKALVIFLDYYFRSMRFRTMLLDVATCNHRAVRCYRRLGFSFIGYEWRKAGNMPCLSLLEDPAYHDMLPFFRRERKCTWVQFMEMELPRTVWLTHFFANSKQKVSSHSDPVLRSYY